MNVLILAASIIDDESSNCIPFYLLEDNGVSHLESIYKKVECLKPSKVVFVFAAKEMKKYCLDRIVNLFGDNTVAVAANEKTSGALCSALLAVEYVNSKNELLILNANEVLEFDFLEAVNHFRGLHLDAGVPIFSSLNPQYSYVRLDEANEVVESAEKQVISRNATAGFYWYKSGENFVSMAMSMMLKKACTSDIFYICPVFNELILRNKRVGVWTFPASQYRPLKNPRQISKMEYI